MNTPSPFGVTTWRFKTASCISIGCTCTLDVHVRMWLSPPLRKRGMGVVIQSKNSLPNVTMCYHVTFDILRFVRYTYATYVTVTFINFKPKTDLFNCTIKKYWHMRTFLEFFFVCCLIYYLFPECSARWIPSYRACVVIWGYISNSIFTVYAINQF